MKPQPASQNCLSKIVLIPLILLSLTVAGRSSVSIPEILSAVKKADSSGKEKQLFELKLDGVKKLEEAEQAIEIRIHSAQEKLNQEKPVWQAKADSAAAVAKNIYAQHHNKHPEGSSELAYWRQELANAVAATNGFMEKADAVQKKYDDLVAEKERILQERFAKANEVINQLMEKGIPCAKELDQNATSEQLKFCGMIYFDGADKNLPIMPENGFGRGTNFFSTDAVVVPEYDQKAREKKENDIKEMIRTSTAPVRKPIVVPPPSSGSIQKEPTATERLRNALQNFLPTPKRQPTSVTSVRG